MKKAIIFTDGACVGNGKSFSRGGIGVFFGKGDKRNFSGKLKGTPQTNNRAELSAVIKALTLLKQDEKDVTIYTDSKYVCKSVNDYMKKWVETDWKLSTGKPVKNKDLFIEFNDLMLLNKIEGKDIKIRWIKGHAGLFGNEKADELAREGTKKHFKK